MGSASLTRTKIGSGSLSSLTLQAGLSWLGHGTRCCAESVGELAVPVWFIGQPGGHHWSPVGILVVVDLADCRRSITQARHLLHEINRCTRTDDIRVRIRGSSDRGRALAALTRCPDAGAGCRHLLIGPGRADPQPSARHGGPRLLAVRPGGGMASWEGATAATPAAAAVRRRLR